MTNHFGLIGFDRYRIQCIIGVEPSERQNEQEIYVDLRVETDFSEAASDDLNKTIDYMQLALICKETAIAGRYFLLERYAYEVLEAILSRYRVKSAWIRVRKPGAIPGAECSVIELTHKSDLIDIATE